MIYAVERSVSQFSYVSCVVVTVLILLLSVSAVSFSGEPLAAQSTPKIEVVDSPSNEHFGTIEVVGIHAEILKRLKTANLTVTEWRQLFPVYTGADLPNETDKKPTLLGAYHVETDAIRFRPRFPLVNGLAYCAQFRFDLLPTLIDLPQQPSSSPVLQTTFSLPKPPEIPTTVVTHIFPSADEIPENLLKFYVHFSTPMSRGNVYQNIYLMEASGTKIDAPFLELDEELWTPNTQRLTLFFDPGRIKRGLRPHQDLGLALQSGQTYHLVIKRDLKDANGNKLVKEFRKVFTVVAADRASPNYHDWAVITPAMGEFEPLIIRFTEPLDHALLNRLLTVKNPSGEPIRGAIEISKQETEWKFIPEIAWIKGTHLIEVDTALEDLAGNRPNRLFDVDLLDTTDRPNRVDRITLQFDVRDPSPKDVSEQ